MCSSHLIRQWIAKDKSLKYYVPDTCNLLHEGKWNLQKEGSLTMADYDFAKIEKKLSKYLDEDRSQHTMGVMYTSACLAMVHGYDVKDAQVAGTSS